MVQREDPSSPICSALSSVVLRYADWSSLVPDQVIEAAAWVYVVSYSAHPGSCLEGGECVQLGHDFVSVLRSCRALPASKRSLSRGRGALGREDLFEVDSPKMHLEVYMTLRVLS